MYIPLPLGLEEHEVHVRWPLAYAGLFRANYGLYFLAVNAVVELILALMLRENALEITRACTHAPPCTS